MEALCCSFLMEAETLLEHRRRARSTRRRRDWWGGASDMLGQCGSNKHLLHGVTPRSGRQVGNMNKWEFGAVAVQLLEELLISKECWGAGKRTWRLLR